MFSILAQYSRDQDERFSLSDAVDKVEAFIMLLNLSVYFPEMHQQEDPLLFLLHGERAIAFYREGCPVLVFSIEDDAGFRYLDPQDQQYFAQQFRLHPCPSEVAETLPEKTKFKPPNSPISYTVVIKPCSDPGYVFVQMSFETRQGREVVTAFSEFELLWDYYLSTLNG